MIQILINDSNVKELKLSDLLSGNFGNKMIFYKTNGVSVPVFLKEITGDRDIREHKYGFVSPVFNRTPSYVGGTMHASISLCMKSRKLYVVDSNDWRHIFKEF